jgi:hypothetical protein
MLNFKKSTIIHPVLFSLFPILAIISLNLNEIILIDTGFSFLITLLVAFASWLILNLFLKNKFKSGLITSLGIFLFFSYGTFIDTFAEIGVDVSTLPFSHHTYAVPLYFFIFCIVTFRIIKIKKHVIDITILTNIIGIALIVMLLPNIAVFAYDDRNNELQHNDMDYQILQEPELKDRPNIYYIIVDEYTSDEILIEIYDFDNQEFLSDLTERGFYVPSHGYANYPTSLLAVTSTLNMSYLNDKKIDPTFDSRNEFYNNNQIMQILKSLDYTIISMSSQYGYPEISDHHLCPTALFVNQFHHTLIDGSIWQPFSSFFFTAGDPQRDRVLCKFSELTTLEDSFDQPFFVFDHIMSPHPPYLFGPNGESLNSEFLSIGAASWDNKSGYVNQVQFINKKIIETVDKILLESDLPPIIIIQGDHGTPTQLGGGGLSWNNINDDSITERMSIFNAYYFPNTNSTIIYDGITPVNSFRLMLNNYFNGNYDLLEDKMYFSTYQDQFTFSDVTLLLESRNLPD